MLDIAVGVADDPSVAGRIVEDRGGQRRRRMLGFMLLDEGLERPGPDQGPIAAQHERLALEIAQVLFAAHNRVGGAQLLGLVYPDDVGRFLGKSLLHLVGAEAHHHVDPVHPHTAAGIEHIGQHGPPGHLVQHLGQVGVHPAAHSGRQQNRHSFRHKTSRFRMMIRVL